VTERIDDLERAHDAVARRSWAEAYSIYHELGSSDLAPAEWESFADAAWWMGHQDGSTAARQKAYTGFAEAGDDRSAGRVAGRLSIEHFLREEPAVGAGWLARAQRHAQALPDCVELGFLAMLQGAIAFYGRDFDAALPLLEHGREIGERFGDRDLLGMTIHLQGLILIASGRTGEGVTMLDEAMTSVVAGELSDYFTGAIYCNVIDACLGIADVRRAAEWSEAAQRWVASIPPESPYPGLCRINRATVASLRGDWSEAEAEAMRAAEELSYNPSLVAEALYQAGDIRRRLGDLAGAEEAFERAAELGKDPQPGLALLRLAQGKVDAALAALRVAGDPGNPLARARRLWALVDAALAAGDTETARSAAAELDGMAEGADALVFDASASTVRGSILLAEGDGSGALPILRHACRVWQDLRLPYEGARARILCGLALRSVGDEDDARLELRGALAAFERLGATMDAVRASDLLAEPKTLPRGLTAREAEVLRLVAAGKTNRDIAVELVISEHTVARHLQNMFVKLGVSSRSAATAFAFEHDLA
jgi:DNA-binding CsgD family transcriptional regulator